MPDNVELAWAAGFFDGEGCTGLYKGHFTMRVGKSGDTCPEVLLRFHRAVGIGDIRGPYIVENRKPQWRWEAGSFEKVQAVVAMLWSYLSSVKREQARLVLAQSSTWSPPSSLPERGYKGRYKGNGVHHGRPASMRPEFKVCKNGHPQDGVNNYRGPSGKNICRPCHRDWMRERRDQAKDVTGRAG